VKDKEDGKVTKFEVREMVEDDNLSLHSLDDSDFLVCSAPCIWVTLWLNVENGLWPTSSLTQCDNGNDASAEDSPGSSKEPQRKGASLKDPRLVFSYICVLVVRRSAVCSTKPTRNC
jgi:hypothetical protein